MKKIISVALFLSLLILFHTSSANAEFQKFIAYDTPNDKGDSITLEWDELDSNLGIKEVKIFRSDQRDGRFVEVEVIDPISTSYVDNGVKSGKTLFYRLVVNSRNGIFSFELDEAVIAKAQWFNTDLIYFLILTLLLVASIVYYTETARRGKRHFVRKIAGLDAVEEAIGRATEMGRPLLYVPGIMDMDNVQTLAALNILGMVAKKVAEYDTPLLMPVSKSLVMTTGREIIKEAYVAAGRPDAYDERDIYYTTDAQFGYVAAVNGVIVRKKPATCMFLGAFYAESLILAEVGNSIGAIQIAGTAMPSQIPFFIAACDYTLIGEELFAASAYLSQNPQEIGSLKGQDFGKMVAMIAIIFGVLFSTIASISGSSFFQNASSTIIKFFNT